MVEINRIAAVVSPVGMLKCVEQYEWIVESDFLVPWCHKKSPFEALNLGKDLEKKQ